MRPEVLQSEPLPWVDPALAYRELYAARPTSFWLDSGPAAVTGSSVMGASDVVIRHSGEHPLLEAVRSGLDEGADAPVPAPDDGFRLGWVGYLGYESAEGAGEPEPGHPVAALMFVDRALRFDHAARTVTLLGLSEAGAEWEGAEWVGALAEWRRETEAVLAALRGAATPEPEPAPGPAEARWRHSDDEYLAMIEACQAAIREGDAYQLCLTNRVSVPGSFDPLGRYLALRASSPSHHGGLLRFGELALLSASPEQFLAVSPGGLVHTTPIKGTRPRGSTPEADERLRRELLKSEKERAENLMIVDLMRNDLARVCEPSSIRVARLLAVESYPHVHQLVSTISGQLRAGLTVVEALAACFPAGSMTGAPKAEARSILARLEGAPRGLYSGVFGYIGLDGRADLAMSIRSIVLDARGATIGSGGGLTALSVPREELAEVKLKAAALLAVLGATE